MKALIIDDEKEEAAKFAAELTAMKFECKSVVTWQEGLDHILTGKFDLAVIDIMLDADKRGEELVRRARLLGVKTRIMCVSARVGAEQRADGLILGADDHMAKPCLPREFRARIDHMMRGVSYEKLSANPSFGDIVLDTKSRTATFGGTTVEFTEEEFDLLAILVRAKGDTVPSRAIRSMLGLGCRSRQCPPLDDNGAVRTVVWRLRDKIEKATGKERIKTCHGEGYAIC